MKSNFGKFLTLVKDVFRGEYPYTCSNHIPPDLPIVVLDFGSGDNIVNSDLAIFVSRFLGMARRPIFATQATYRVLVRKRWNYLYLREVDHPYLAENPAATEEFFRSLAGLLEPGTGLMLVTQAFHATRIARQAENWGYQVYLPEHLPRHFVSNDPAIWARCRFLCCLREIFALLRLERR